MNNKKYPYLDIDESALLNGLKQIQKIGEIIRTHSCLDCNDCPFDYYCNNGDICDIHLYDDEEIDRIVDALTVMNKKIKNDKLTF